MLQNKKYNNMPNIGIQEMSDKTVEMSSKKKHYLINN
jgi:hypothetical protein